MKNWIPEIYDKNWNLINVDKCTSKDFWQTLGHFLKIDQKILWFVWKKQHEINRPKK